MSFADNQLAPFARRTLCAGLSVITSQKTTVTTTTTKTKGG